MTERVRLWLERGGRGYFGSATPRAASRCAEDDPRILVVPGRGRHVHRSATCDDPSFAPGPPARTRSRSPRTSTIRTRSRSGTRTRRLQAGYVPAVNAPELTRRRAGRLESEQGRRRAPRAARTAATPGSGRRARDPRAPARAADAARPLLARARADRVDRARRHDRVLVPERRLGARAGVSGSSRTTRSSTPATRSSGRSRCGARRRAGRSSSASTASCRAPGA